MRLSVVGLVSLVLVSAAASASAAIFTGEFQEITPTPASFVLGTDFNVFADDPLWPPAVGDATGWLQTAGLGDVGDFAGFTPGNIALIERGTLVFSLKIANAEAAGAIAAIIYNNQPGLNTGVLVGPTSIPAILLSHDLGEAFVSRLQSEQIQVRVAVSTVIPEPTAFLVWSLLGPMGIAAVAWRRRRAR